VQKTLAVALSLLTYDDTQLQDLELSLLTTAKHHDAPTLYRLHTVPGIGTILRLGLRYAMHCLDRVPRVQNFAASCRVVQCRQESSGKRVGPAGKNIGPAPRTWAFSDAATLFLRNNRQGQAALHGSRERMESL
jgi:hypothetical protein